MKSQHSTLCYKQNGLQDDLQVMESPAQSDLDVWMWCLKALFSGGLGGAEQMGGLDDFNSFSQPK